MDILTWIIVGLVAGVLASLVMGGTGYGLIGDIIIGIVGAFVGGWLFSMLGVSSPFGGIAGVIFVAFIGAVGAVVNLAIMWALTHMGVDYIVGSEVSVVGGTWLLSLTLVHIGTATPVSPARRRTISSRTARIRARSAVLTLRPSSRMPVIGLLKDIQFHRSWPVDSSSRSCWWPTTARAIRWRMRGSACAAGAVPVARSVRPLHRAP